MKKIICTAFAVIFVLTSCSPTAADKNSFFEYQKKKIQIQGIWKTAGEEYEIILRLDEENENGRKAELEYLSPETLNGIKFVYENTFITASLGEMAIDIENRNPDTVFRILNMLNLSPDDIMDISLKDEETVAKGRTDKTEWCVTTDKNGNPKSITYKEATVSSSLEITDFQINP